MSDLVRFELLGVAYSIDLSLVESIEPASAEDMDLAEALGVGRAGALRPRERALRLVGGGPALRIGAALSFQALGQALDLPELARGHPWVVGVCLEAEGAPLLRLQPELGVLS